MLGLIAFVAGECPNACSGHGTCGSHDQCTCYQNYQSNDCSERTCPFGIAHVDTPKGDLNGDGMYSGPLETMITGSEVYPWGTTEQYPNADRDEGHFYMECSNKGLCNRVEGTCTCFAGYTGTACIRADCPFDCNGHGVCQSVKEFAEMRRVFDTNDHDVPTGQPIGSDNTLQLNLAIDESYAYDLWDQDKSMGCQCDPGYWGADCYYRKCKYGVDPLFYDNTDGVIHQSTVIHLGSQSTNHGKISGSFRIIFYDVFGERYVTKMIPASRSVVKSEDVRSALEGLPNGVILKPSHDVTSTPGSAVRVSMQSTSGTLTTLGTMGAGLEGDQGAGLGVRGESGDGHGPEFTITFTTNPGVLKSIEIDTSQVTNPGSPDYWVANVRQGQFHSRFVTNLGRINTLKYGSKLVYTNSDWSTDAPVNTMVKVGGQEAFVTVATKYMLTLSEPYLGASIIPTLTDVGIMVSKLNMAASPQTLSISKPGTTVAANHLRSGSKLYTSGCPLESIDPVVVPDDLNVIVGDDHDCHSDIAGVDMETILYRRTDDPSNQNLYKTAGDTMVPTQGLLTTRGSPDIYIVNSTAVGTVKQFVGAKSQFTATSPVTIENQSAIFINNHGPIIVSDFINASTAVKVSSYVHEFFNHRDFNHRAIKFPVYQGLGDENNLTSGTILALNGRRYKVKSRSEVGGLMSKITLTERFAGGQLVQLCVDCITEVLIGSTVRVSSARRVAVEAGDRVVISGYLNDQLAMTVTSTSRDGLTFYVSAGTTQGFPLTPAGSFSFAPEGAGEGGSLFRVLNGAGYVGAKVSEALKPTTYQYVSQCSGRGLCREMFGTCKCFTGFSGDSCDNINELSF